MAWNIVNVSENESGVCLIDNTWDYGKSFAIVNSTAVARTEVFCNIPTLGEGFSSEFAYIAKEGGAETMTVAISSNNNVVLAELKSGQKVVVKVLSECETWYVTQDHVSCEPGEVDTKAVFPKTVSVTLTFADGTTQTLEAVRVSLNVSESS